MKKSSSWHRSVINQFKSFSEEGNEAAMYYLGLCYLTGQGVKQNLEKAHELLEDLARIGHQGAIDALKNPESVGEIDFDKAFTHFQDVETLESLMEISYVGRYFAGLCFLTGQFVTKDVKAAKEILLPYAKRNYRKARLALQDPSCVPKLDMKKILQLAAETAD